jgi:hypothetical protein
MKSVPDFLNLLKSLEDELLANWKQKKFSQEEFTSLSTALFNKHQVGDHFNLEDFLSFIIKTKNHPDIHHYDLNFTENIHFTILRNKHFFIDLYSWATHTEIHSHNFSGCFQILKGRFAQSYYGFQKDRQGANWAEGNLKLKKREVLSVNSTYSIEEGEKFIHQVFHLDNPSVSLCIRTPDTHDKYFSYFYPGFRLNDTTFVRPEYLRIKAFSQYCQIQKGYSSKIAIELIQGLKPSRLMYEYLQGLKTIRVQPNIKVFLEKEIEKHFKKSIGIDLKELRKKHLIHITKLEMSSL